MAMEVLDAVESSAMSARVAVRQLRTGAPLVAAAAGQGRPVRSSPEAQLERQLSAVACATGCSELAAFEPEYRFSPPRRWRFDFAWLALTLACEVEGGLWTRGRHTRGAGYEADCEKYAHALLAGWRVLRVTPRQVASGQAVSWIETLIRGDGVSHD